MRRIRENMIAERIVIEAYAEIIRWLGDADITSRRLIERILKEEGGRRPRGRAQRPVRGLKPAAEATRSPDGAKRNPGAVPGSRVVVAAAK
jgi:hypothetical protein